MGIPNRLNIFYLVPDLFGPPSGIARYCRMVCRALTQAGHSVTALSLLDQSSAATEAQAAFPDLRYAACAGQRKLFIRRAVRMSLAQPDLILLGHPHFAPLGVLLARLSRVRLVNCIYGIDAWEPLSPLRRRALQVSDRIISISRFTADRAAEVNQIPLNKVRILHNCLDPQFQRRASRVSHSAAPMPNLSLLTIARMSLSEQYKGHDVVIQAMPRLLKLFPDLIYDVVGDGDGRAALERLAAQQGVAYAVRFHGVVSDAELTNYYEAASAFVMPSRLEGFGFVFLEAMAYGKAVVCGNMDASVEVVRNGETGFCVDPKNPLAVAEALEKLLCDGELRHQMGECGAQRVAAEFGFERFQATLLEHLWCARS